MKRNRLKNYRVIIGLTQEEVSEKMGISHDFLGKIEQGYRKLSIENALKLVKIYKLNHIEDLLEDEEL